MAMAWAGGDGRKLYSTCSGHGDGEGTVCVQAVSLEWRMRHDSWSPPPGKASWFPSQLCSLPAGIGLAAPLTGQG